MALQTPGSLHLGIRDDPNRAIHRSCLVKVDVADALVVLENGNPALFPRPLGSTLHRPGE